jgi:glycosyltransferase involved in cell wall biosynthesis
MTLFILDPNLEGEAGHHLAYDLAIAREAVARGEAATIVANRRFGPATIEGVRILPHFTETTYAVRHHDPVTGRLDDYRVLNDLLLQELSALPRHEFRPGDCVLVPTTTENHLAGYLGWMKGVDPREAPLFVVHLMFPSGVAVDAAGRSSVEDPLRALFYRLADRIARESGPPVHLFASGGQHGAEFSALLGRPVPPHPLPIRPEPGGPAPRRALVFAGDARVDKGVALLPGLLPRLAAAHPDWVFAAHVNAAASWGEARAAAEALPAIAAGAANLDVTTGRLTPEAYLDLLRGARIALFPYDAALYRRKSSGVLWEAISLGLPVVVPAGTWLENEARHWGAGFVAYPQGGAAAIAAAFADALARIEELAARSAGAGARYRAANGAAALIDQVAALWVRHKATAALVRRAQAMPLDLLRMEAGWHRPETVDGKQVRWTAREPVIAFDWPFEEGWEVELTLLSVFGAEQLDRAEALAGDVPVRVSARRIGAGARLAVQGPGPGRARPRVELKLRLPFTHRPANDARDLGVLVAALRVGPLPQAGAAQGAGAAPGPMARVAGAPGPDGGWPVAPRLAGEVLADPATPCVLAFRFAAGQAAAPQGLALHVNAVPVPLELGREADGWLATATVPAALLRQGAPAAWDLVAEGGAPLLESVSVAPMAGTAMAQGDPDPGAPEAAPAAEAPAAPDAPARDPVPADAPVLRWDLCTGIGPTEGPFEDLGIPAGVRWIVARRARLVLEAPMAAAARLRLRYRSLLPRQEIRAALNGGPATTLAATGRGLREPDEFALDLALAAGANELALDFAGAVREPGTGRELVLLVEAVAFE